MTGESFAIAGLTRNEIHQKRGTLYRTPRWGALETGRGRNALAETADRFHFPVSGNPRLLVKRNQPTLRAETQINTREAGKIFATLQN